MAHLKGVRTTQDKFSLRNLKRKFTPQNGRNYILESVQHAITSPRARERMELGEMYGYYGHGRREMYYNEHQQLRLPEFTIMRVDGQIIQLNNVPAARTLDIKLDGDIVTHTQEILDTDPGRVVNTMEAGSVGGWSWVTDGYESASAARVTLFEGFDYVTTPNFISLNKQPAPMMESAADRETRIVERCKSAGFTESAAVDIAQHYEKMVQHAMFESPLIENEALRARMFEMSGMIADLASNYQKTKAMLETAQANEVGRVAAQQAFISKLPVFLGKADRDALEALNTEEDFRVLSALLESVRAPLPGQGGTQPLPRNYTVISGPSKAVPGGKAPKFS